MNNTIDRYIIASLLFSRSDQAIRHWYETNLGHPCPVRTLHLTFIPPFSTKNSLPLTLPTLPSLPTLTLGVPANFTHPDRTILYLPVFPQNPLIAIHSQLQQHTDLLINPENNNLPDFLPHLTLDYHAAGELAPLTPPPETINLRPPQLLTETTPGIWQPAPQTN